MNSAELSLPKTLTDYDAYFNPGLTLNRTERVEDTASLTSFGIAAQELCCFFVFFFLIKTAHISTNTILHFHNTLQYKAKDKVLLFLTAKHQKQSNVLKRDWQNKVSDSHLMEY